MIQNKVKSKLIFTEKRFNAGYFLNEDALNSFKLEINPQNCIALSELANVFNPPIFKRQFCQPSERAINYCQSSDVTNALEGSDVYINKKQAEKVGSVVKKNQILVTGFGTIGNTRLVNELSEGISYANNVCRIESNGKFPYGYLYAFMTSKFGRSQLNKNASGSVVRYIEAPGIKRTLVPILTEEKQQQIHQLIVDSANLRVEANKLLKEAESEFIISNNLDSIENKITDISENILKKGFKINFKSINSTSIKARNYSERARTIINILNSVSGIKLEDFIVEPFKMGARASFKRINDNNFKGHNLISQGDIHIQNPKKFKQVKIINSNIDDFAQSNMVIIPSAGTLGENEIFTRPLLIYRNFEGFLLSEVIGKFKCKNEIDAAYLYVFLNTKFAFRILRAMVYGTNLLYPNWLLLKNINVPIIDEINKKRIANKVLEAYNNRHLANVKENQAINLIENEIDAWQ